ncbi:MAG: transposase [Planctomycetaceae bacterium]|nr:transposase [Planctomycetaceae bacterium]
MRVTDPSTGKTFFSKRRLRFDDGMAPRELTFSCYHRYCFLDHDRTRHWMIEALEEARAAWPIWLWAYVIMPEHVHLLVAPREPGVEVGRFAGFVKQKVARRAINWLEQHAPEWLPRITVREGARLRRRFWQPGGGYDRNVHEVSTLFAMIEHIHANPVRRGLCERAVDWHWSSARWYDGETVIPIAMDRTLPTLHKPVSGRETT